MSSSAIRRYVVILAAAVTAASVWQPVATAQPGGYDDVPEDAYYTTPVADLAAEGVFTGTGCVAGCVAGFCPGEPIDRKTMAVWTVRILDGEDPPAVAESRFSDVDAGSFHAPFIERMAELGVTTGCGDGTGFCPDRTVTRAQMAVFLSRAYSLPEGPDPSFSDVASDAWYVSEVAKLAASGITVGCGDGSMFCPGRDATRAQMATFLWRAENPEWRDDSEPANTPVSLNAAMDGGGVIAGDCAIRNDGVMVCWGSGEATARDGTFKAVNADVEYHKCAIRTDDSVECWYDGGALGAPPGAFTAVTTAEAQFPAAEDQFPELYSCGIRTDGTVTCWQSLEGGGYSDAPQCQELESFGFVFTICSTNILQPAAGMFKAISRACAIGMDDTVSCWSPYYDFDEIEIHGTPPDGGTYKVLSLGQSHSCAIRTDDTLTCWGNNEYGKLDHPVGEYKAVSSGYHHSCGIRTDDTLTCWGRNEVGASNAPAGEFIAVSAENGTSCAIKKADNTILCWGGSYEPHITNGLEPPEGSFGPG